MNQSRILSYHKRRGSIVNISRGSSIFQLSRSVLHHNSTTTNSRSQHHKPFKTPNVPLFTIHPRTLGSPNRNNVFRTRLRAVFATTTRKPKPSTPTRPSSLPTTLTGTITLRHSPHNRDRCHTTPPLHIRRVDASLTRKIHKTKARLRCRSAPFIQRIMAATREGGEAPGACAAIEFGGFEFGGGGVPAGKGPRFWVVCEAAREG